MRLGGPGLWVGGLLGLGLESSGFRARGLRVKRVYGLKVAVVWGSGLRVQGLASQRQEVMSHASGNGS